MDEGKSGAYSSETVSELEYECVSFFGEPCFPMGRPDICVMNDPIPEMHWMDLDQN